MLTARAGSSRRSPSSPSARGSRVAFGTCRSTCARQFASATSCAPHAERPYGGGFAAQRIADPRDRERFLELVKGAMASSIHKGEPPLSVPLRNSPREKPPPTTPAIKREDPTRRAATRPMRRRTKAFAMSRPRRGTRRHCARRSRAIRWMHGMMRFCSPRRLRGRLRVLLGLTPSSSGAPGSRRRLMPVENDRRHQPIEHRFRRDIPARSVTGLVPTEFDRIEPVAPAV